MRALIPDTGTGERHGMTDIQDMAREEPAADRGGRPQFPQYAVLRGPVRPDLIRNELLAEIFADSVRAHGDSVCLEAGGLRLTYADVEARAPDSAERSPMPPSSSRLPRNLTGRNRNGNAADARMAVSRFPC